MGEARPPPDPARQARQPLPEDPVQGGGWPLFWVLGALLLAVPIGELWLMFSLPVSLEAHLAWAGLTGLVGWLVARREGLSLWAELESNIQNRRLPTAEGVDAMLLVVGGWGLMVPGYLTDLAGAALLIPPARQALIDPIRQTIRARLP